jgi:hypothetical protein
VPWAINQVFWHARPVFDRTMKTGTALRAAQIAALKGRPGDVRAASDAHRKAVADAVQQATTLAAKHGAHPAIDQLARMLEAVSLSATAPAHPGRLTELVQPSGFEALAGVTPAGAKHPFPAAITAPAAPGGGATGMRRETKQQTKEQSKEQSKEDRQAERRRAQEAAAQRKAAEADLKAAQRAHEAATAVVSTAERDVDRAKRALDAAQQALERAQRERESAAQKVAFAKAALR